MFWRAKKISLSVNGMSCEHCEQSVVQALAEVSGVDRAKADHSKSRVEVFYKDEPPNVDIVSEKIRSLGYEVLDR